MSISIPSTARYRLRDILFCASLGCLCFIRRWFDLEILQVRGLDFYRSAPRDPGLLVATLLSSSILALMFWLLAHCVRRADNSRLTALHEKRITYAGSARERGHAPIGTPSSV